MYLVTQLAELFFNVITHVRMYMYICTCASMYCMYPQPTPLCAKVSVQLFDARNHYHEVACEYSSSLNGLQTKTRIEFLERLVRFYVCAYVHTVCTEVCDLL